MVIKERVEINLSIQGPSKVQEVKIRIISKGNYPAVARLRKAFKTESGSSADICIAVGGDGTFVLAASEFDGPILPVRGRENGSAGFYADATVDDIDRIIKALGSGSYTVETIARKLAARCNGKTAYAANEVALKSSGEEIYFSIYDSSSGRRVRVSPFVMGGDGVLVTGRVGSTGYNRSANGPIILSDSVLCLTFLNCDGPYKNPIVIDSKCKVELVVEKGAGTLKCDNRNITEVKRGDRIAICMSGKELRVVRFPDAMEPTYKKLERLIMRKAVGKF